MDLSISQAQDLYRGMWWLDSHENGFTCVWWLDGHQNGFKFVGWLDSHELVSHKESMISVACCSRETAHLTQAPYSHGRPVD